MPFLSIITICKNPSYKIIKTINSVLQQSFQNYEYIIFDGKSNDGTGEYLEILKKKKIINKIFIEKDDGIYQALNKALSIAKGEYVGLVHAGDTYEKNVFVNLVPHMNGINDVIYGSGYISNNFSKTFIPIKNDAHEQLNKRMSILHPSTFIKRSVYQKLNYYSTDYKIAGDFDFLTKAYNKKFIFKHLDFSFSTMLFGGISSQLKYVPLMAKETGSILYGPKASLIKYNYIFYYMNKHFLYGLIINLKIKLNFLKNWLL